MKIYEYIKENSAKIALLIVEFCGSILFFISIAIGFSPEFRSLGDFDEHSIWAAGAFFGIFFIPFMSWVVTPILRKIVSLFIREKVDFE